MKYKPGDKVRVKSDLKIGNYYYMEHSKSIRNVFVDDMKHLLGKEVTIKKGSPSSNQYEIEENCNGCYWTGGMFEPLKEENEI
jgi:hypothetical protein